MGKELRTHKRYAEFRKGTSDKFYEIEVTELEEDGKARITYRYGRIGQAGQSKPDESMGYTWAVDVADAKFEEKLEKGYEEAKSPLHALAAALETPADRPNKGLPPAAVAVPTWNTGNCSANERLMAFAEKYIEKLNLIRASRDVLLEKIYNQQITNLFKQFAEEWHRIADSKQLLDVDIVPIRARIGVLYQALRSQRGTSHLVPDWSRAYADGA